MKEKYKNDFIQAGAFAKEVRAFGKSLIKPGASYNDVISQINKKIIDLGAIPAFPPQIALNEVAAHYLPSPIEDIIFSNQVVKLDVGICFNGAIGDCAVTIDLSGKHQDLIDAAEAALLAAEKKIKVGLPVREIGKTIAEEITARGFDPVMNLSGHGLGFNKIHCPPGIPNYDDNSKAVVKPGMTFAIEPFATNGKGFIFEAPNPMIFSVVKSRKTESSLAEKLLIKMKTFNGLPFAMHDLLDVVAYEEAQKGIEELLKLGIIYGYGPLIECGLGMVAQAENSVLVDNDGTVTITTR